MHACYLMRWSAIYLILFYLPALIHGYTLALKFSSDRFIYVYIIIYLARILYISADQCFTCICFCLYTNTPIWYISGSGDSLLTCADIHQYYIYLISARFVKTEKFWLTSFEVFRQIKRCQMIHNFLLRLFIRAPDERFRDPVFIFVHSVTVCIVLFNISAVLYLPVF